jgi:putative addiction module killer protein
MTENNKSMYAIDTTPEFTGWLGGIKDAQGKAAVTVRLLRAQNGNFGDTEPVGNGLSEMRVFVGPGYRVYYVRSGQTSYLMLYGSDKTDQKRGIKRAKEILDALRGA